MFPSAWVLMRDCGEPISKRATQPRFSATRPLCILILVVKEESSIVTTSATRQGPSSASKGKCESGGQRTLQQERRRRGLMARVVERGGILTKRRLLTCLLDTVVVACKGPLRRCSLDWRARCPEETNVGGASAAACGRGSGVGRFAESYPANISHAIAVAGDGDVISAASDAPYEVIRASFREKSVARVQEMPLHS